MKDEGDRGDVEENEECVSSPGVLTNAIGVPRRKSGQDTKRSEESLMVGSYRTGLSSSELLKEMGEAFERRKKTGCTVGISFVLD